MVALSAFAAPASANAVRPAIQPTPASLQMSAAAVQGSPYYDERRNNGLIPVLIVLGLFIGAVIYILSDDGDGRINFRPEPVSPD